MIPHDDGMPFLNGQKVRHRAALRGWDLHKLAETAELPVRAVQNSTRAVRPQTMKITRIYALGRALALPGEDAVTVAAEIVADPTVAAEIRASNNDGVPDTPPKQPTRTNTGPTRRETTEQTKGPRRNNAEVAA
ncbi:hypothetical protein [Amycolatopsis lurida]|nr:hypothetical protein [Amycolatopsis lurida]